MLKWRCPFCNQGAIITSSNYRREFALFSGIVGIDKIVVCDIIECPNLDCNQFTFTVKLHKDSLPGSATYPEDRIGEEIKKWNLIPASEARSFPDYIPEPIIKDYTEACLIKDLSPKASATISRRCLQGMIRDFWSVKGKNLFEEIETIKDNVESQTWEAIDAVREVGNIGAHMEKDINLIIEVEPDEAELLINLIEILMKDWYINRHERQETLIAIKKLGDQKKSQKKKGGIKAKDE